MPARRASAGERNVCATPFRVKVPLSPEKTPVMILTSVLLPAPFAPMSAWISPRETVSVADLRATTEPNRLARSRTSSRGVESFIVSGLASARVSTSMIRRLWNNPWERAPAERDRRWRERLLFAGTLAGLFLRRGEVTVVLLRAVDRIGRRDVRVVERLQLLHGFVRQVVIRGGRDGRHAVAGLLLQDIERNDESGRADRRRIADGDAGEPVLLVVDQLLEEAVVVGAHERHERLMRGLHPLDHRVVDTRRPSAVEMLARSQHCRH